MIIAMIVSMIFSIAAFVVIIVHAVKQSGEQWDTYVRVSHQINAADRKTRELQELVNKYIKGRLITEGSQVCLKHNEVGTWDIVAVEDSAPDEKDDG